MGLAIRVASVLARPHLAPVGDPAEYLGQANLLVAGKGWVEPYVFAQTGKLVQTAKLPPLYTMLMALCSLVGFKSFFAHRIWSAVLSSSGVVLGAALGRRLGGPSVGLMAAFGVALYPNMWMSAGLGMSETVSPLMVLIVLLLAYRMWERPTVARAVTLGAVIGLAGLARDELLLLVPLVLAPAVLGRGWTSWPGRFRALGAGVAATVLVLAPWVTFNLVRFDRPVFITDRLGATMAAANCPSTYHGPLTGYWWMPCAEAAVAGAGGRGAGGAVGTDEPAGDAVATSEALRYIVGHAGRLPAVEWARLGRTFGFYRVSQQMLLDIRVEGRPWLWEWVGLWSYYVLAVTAPVGVWLVRRRGLPVFPLVAVLVDVVMAVLVTLGQTRFRATLEPVLVIGSSMALVGLWARVRPGRLFSGTGEETHGVEGGAVPGEQPGPVEGGHLHASSQERV